MNNYEALEKLNDLRLRGVITEEEFVAEKKKLLENYAQTPFRDGTIWGLSPNTYCVLMNLAPLMFWTVLGLFVPLVMWIIKKDEFPIVDVHGKNILNWLISAAIYSLVGAVLSFVFIGIPMLIVLGTLVFVFAIIAALSASRGEVWVYPLSFKFLK